MQCINECGNELVGRQREFCSDKCRKARSRTKTDKQEAAHGHKSDNVRVTDKSDIVFPTVVDTPGADIPFIEKPVNFGQPDCQCGNCKSNRATGNKHIFNHGTYKPASQLGHNELNRVPLPGDVDYV